MLRMTKDFITVSLGNSNTDSHAQIWVWFRPLKLQWTCWKWSSSEL